MGKAGTITFSYPEGLGVGGRGGGVEGYSREV